MLGLGRLYDIGLGVAPVDASTAGLTGKRISMQGCGGIDVVLIYGAGTAGDDPVPSLQQHTAYTGGSSASLAIIDEYYYKSETALDNDETWVVATQSAAAIISANLTHAEEQNIYVIHVPATALSDGYTHISVNQADLSNNAQLAAALYLRVDLVHQRKVSLLPNLLRPGAANA